jgi:hypothetical protein
LYTSGRGACGGLAASFIAIVLFVATVRYSIGLDGDRLRYVAAALMIAIGVVLLGGYRLQKAHLLINEI